MGDDERTPALDGLAASGVEHHVVRTRPAGSPEESAELQGIPLDALLRTIVVRRAEDDYVFVLVPGGRRFRRRGREHRLCIPHRSARS
jgi:Cys-tRNA(Pro)/Cys-tRNA(Cys) deacylase